MWLHEFIDHKRIGYECSMGVILDETADVNERTRTAEPPADGNGVQILHRLTRGRQARPEPVSHHLTFRRLREKGFGEMGISW